MLTRKTIIETIEMLAAEFNVHVPAITIPETHTKRGRNGYYSYKQELIVGAYAWRGIDAVLHEFAHHLDFQNRGCSDHSAAFGRALLRVAAAYYGNVSGYAWCSEYKSLRKFHITGKLTRKVYNQVAQIKAA